MRYLIDSLDLKEKLRRLTTNTAEVVRNNRVKLIPNFWLETRELY